MRLVQAFLGFRVFVADQSYFGRFVSMKIADNIRTPVPIANYTNADHTAPCGCSIPRRRRRSEGRLPGAGFRTLRLRGTAQRLLHAPEVERGFKAGVSSGKPSMSAVTGENR